jgi:hypothetical protein
LWQPAPLSTDGVPTKTATVLKSTALGKKTLVKNRLVAVPDNGFGRRWMGTLRMTLMQNTCWKKKKQQGLR